MYREAAETIKQQEIAIIKGQKDPVVVPEAPVAVEQKEAKVTIGAADAGTEEPPKDQQVQSQPEAAGSAQIADEEVPPAITWNENMEMKLANHCLQHVLRKIAIPPIENEKGFKCEKAAREILQRVGNHV
jgi:hypothetical protein